MTLRKKAILIVLAIFVVGAAADLIMEFAGLGKPVGEPKLQNGVVVYFFHSATHCAACDKMSPLTREAVEGGFKNQIAGKRLVLTEAEYDAPANAALVKNLGISGLSIVVAKFKDGQETSHRELSGAVGRLDDPKGFIAYVRDEVRKELAQ